MTKSTDKPKAVAFYLPQYYPNSENNQWWGQGFTEWRNVGSARPLYPGHKQPRVPADLGYYDLRLDEVRASQAELAVRAGLSAFCYWNYWMGGEKTLLSLPLKKLLANPEPRFPFCLAWANHDWEKKAWSKDHHNPSSNKLLCKQKYLGIVDYQKYFESLLGAFTDPRYFKVGGRLFFLVYAPDSLPNAAEFIECWQALAKINGLPSIYFVAHTRKVESPHKYTALGFDAVNFSPNRLPFQDRRFGKLIFARDRLLSRPAIVSYRRAIKVFDHPLNNNPDVIPTIIPNWDHTPRSGKYGIVMANSTPHLFRKHVRNVFRSCEVANRSDAIVMVKSWNEWGEGNYMEPDDEFGTGYIDALSDEINIS